MSTREPHDLFEGFETEDFEAYLPEKWNSNMFTLDRRRVKDKLEILGRALLSRLEARDLTLAMHLSDEFPSLWNKKRVDTQWLFFSRDTAAQSELADLFDKERTLADNLADPSPRYRHVFLGVSLNADELKIGLHLHFDAWVDRKNLENLLFLEQSAAKLEEIIKQLPGHYSAALEELKALSPGELGSGELQELFRSFIDEKSEIFIGARLPKDQVSVLGGDAATIAEEAFDLLEPLYRFIAWSRDNDAISMDQLIAERNEALRASRAELDRERAEREAERREKQAEGLKLREEIAERLKETEDWRRREMAARRSAALARAAVNAEAEDARARAERLAANWNLKGPEKKSAPAGDLSLSENKARSSTEDSTQRSKNTASRPPKSRTSDGHLDSAKSTAPKSGPLTVGDSVEITSGFLKGRQGTVQEIYEKGELKISFGPLSSRLSTKEVTRISTPPKDAHFSRGPGSKPKRRAKHQSAPPKHFRVKLPKSPENSPTNLAGGRENDNQREPSRSKEERSR